MNHRIIYPFTIFKGVFSLMNCYKIEQIDVLRLLLANEDLLQKFQNVIGDPVLFDDHERYLEMAIRLDPNDKEMIYRK